MWCVSRLKIREPARLSSSSEGRVALINMRYFLLPDGKSTLLFVFLSVNFWYRQSGKIGTSTVYSAILRDPTAFTRNIDSLGGFTGYK